MTAKTLLLLLLSSSTLGLFVSMAFVEMKERSTVHQQAEDAQCYAREEPPAITYESTDRNTILVQSPSRELLILIYSQYEEITYGDRNHPLAFRYSQEIMERIELRNEVEFHADARTMRRVDRAIRNAKEIYRSR